MPSKPTRRHPDAETGAPAQADQRSDAGRETSGQQLEPSVAEESADNRPHRPVRARLDRDRANAIDVP